MSTSAVRHLADLVLECISDVRKYGNWYSWTVFDPIDDSAKSKETYECLEMILIKIGYSTDLECFERVDLESTWQIQIKVIA